MTIKETNLKQYLLNTNYFIDNEYLDRYIDLVCNYSSKLDGYWEKHHVLQVAYYKYLYNCSTRAEALKYANKDINNFSINLLYKDHCKAHFLLYFCTSSILKASNCEAVSFIVNMYNDLTKNKIININNIDFDELQNYKNIIMEDDSSRYWTSSDINILKNNYTTHGVAYCANLVGRSYSATKSKANSLNICVDINAWTVEDIQFLIDNYPIYGEAYCSEYLQRTKSATRAKAKELNIKMLKWWTIEDDNFLINNYNDLGPESCSIYLKRSYGSIVARARRLNLTKQNNYTKTDIEFIKLHYPKEGIDFCANKLHRSKAAIKRIAAKYKIRCLPQGNPIYCVELDREFESIASASKLLHISDGNICSVIHNRLESTNGLHFIKISKEDYYKCKKNV